MLAVMRLPDGNTIAERQAEAVAGWYRADAGEPAIEESDAFLQLVLEQCSRNWRLWNQEDQARRTDVNDEVSAKVKRAIDGLNQRRNDLIEKLDEALLTELGAALNESAPLNSETPGSMIDRMAIMGLKCYHMEREAGRAEAGPEHCERCRGKLEVLREQRGDLARCFDEIIAATRSGERRFKIYRQYKMYNDPSLNPELYRRRGGPRK